MKYQSLVIYYFSGTGNARNAALWIADVARTKGLDTHLINIDRFKKIQIPEHDGNILIGFCTPTHGFNVPPIMLKFISKFPKLKNANVFILNTRGGLKFHKWFIPGLSGVAQYLPALILWLKGFGIVGMQPLDLPSNWLILHPGLKGKVVLSIYNRCEKIVNDFTELLLNGKRTYKAFFSLPFDLAMIPIAIGYYFVGRFFFAKTLIATNACDNCDLCIKQCPVRAIKVTKSKPFWTYACESCMRCVNKCPKRAIETAHGFAGLIVVLIYTLILPYLFIQLGRFEIMGRSFISYMPDPVWSVIKAILFLLILFLGYRLLHMIMKNKVINRVIAYSSFSKYTFWRRYKIPNMSNAQRK